MTSDLPLRCACGSLQGSALALSPKVGTHVVCYCNDCQAFAHFLGRADILDPAGGTALFQMAPSRLRLTRGTEVGVRDGILGKPVGYFETKAAKGPLPPAAGGSPLRALGKTLRLLGKWWLTGAGTPSPFFDENTRRPRVEPRVLTPEERRSL